MCKRKSAMGRRIYRYKLCSVRTMWEKKNKCRCRKEGGGSGEGGGGGTYTLSTKTSSKYWESDQILIRELRVGGLEQFRFLCNCLPTPSLSQHLTLTSHIGQNVGLGDG